MKNLSLPNLQAGATLIELLVVIAIVLILSGLGLVNYRDVQAKNELRDAAEQILSAIMETHVLALGPRASGPVGITDYLMEFQPGGQSNIYQIYERSGQPPTDQVIPGRVYQLMPDISFKDFANWSASPTLKLLTFNVNQQGMIRQAPQNGNIFWGLELASNRLPNRCKNLKIYRSPFKVEIEDTSC